MLAVTLCLGVIPALAQNAKAGQADKILNGIVIGSDGDTPLAGVVIHSKENPKEVATTDAHGEYKFSVSPTTQTVVFEMMGYDTKEIKVADTYLFTLVTMIVQANALEESVVVGFGTQKKESLVGAVQAVKPADLATSSSNLTTSFAGNIPGLIARQTSGEPGADGAAFYIRGISTFGANSSALIVLDGVEITSSMLNNIPTEAIESMSVIKDATATALYGSRGANGVLIVTTKEGRNSEKIAISASFDNTVSMPTMVQDVADGVQYMELYNEALYNVARQSGAAYMPFYSSEKIEGTRNHLDPYVYPNNDWYGMLFKDFAMNQRFNVSLRGGGKKVNYFLNASIYNENGIIKEPKDALLDVPQQQEVHVPEQRHRPGHKDDQGFDETEHAASVPGQPLRVHFQPLLLHDAREPGALPGRSSCPGRRHFRKVRQQRHLGHRFQRPQPLRFAQPRLQGAIPVMDDRVPQR